MFSYKENICNLGYFLFLKLLPPPNYEVLKSYVPQFQDKIGRCLETKDLMFYLILC